MRKKSTESLHQCLSQATVLTTSCGIFALKCYKPLWQPERYITFSFRVRRGHLTTKVRFLYQCSKMQLITFQNFHIQTWFSQFLGFFSLKCWFKGQMISRIHLILPNAYKLMCFDRNINGNRNVKFLECDKWSLHWYKNLTLVVFVLGNKQF